MELVGTRPKKRGLGTALGRRTRPLVACAFGERSEQTGPIVRQRRPPAYSRCRRLSDLWEAYGHVVPRRQPRSVETAREETSHRERWNNTLRQAHARYVRKTLSFSQSDFYPELVTRLFSIRYNLLRRICVT